MTRVGSDSSPKKPCRILYIIDGLEGDGAERQFCELVKGVFDVESIEPHVVVLEENDSGHAWMLEEKGIVGHLYKSVLKRPNSSEPHCRYNFRHFSIQFFNLTGLSAVSGPRWVRVPAFSGNADGFSPQQEFQSPHVIG